MSENATLGYEIVASNEFFCLTEMTLKTDFCPGSSVGKTLN